MNKEEVFYNAVAIALLGDRRAIGKTNQDTGSWEKTYAALLERQRDHRRLFPYGKGASEIPLPDPELAADRLEKKGVRIVLGKDPLFPRALREIPHPPHAIYVKGDLSALKMDEGGASHAIAIVGTRRATQDGKTLARRFGAALSSAGFAIVSGLAFGIDAAAHEGCLAGRNGRAIAVLARGLDEVHPRSNEGLARKIVASGGTIVSEYPMREPPLAYRFIERNRLVSGLSRGTLIIEAPERSGALSTARFALEQNRDVFVLPGNVSQGNYRGSNRLIRQGASLVTSPEDIFETYGMVIKSPRETVTEKAERMASHGALTLEESLVIRAIALAESGGATPPNVDKISAMAKLEPRIVNRTLTLLIIKDVIKESADGFAMKND